MNSRQQLQSSRLLTERGKGRAGRAATKGDDFGSFLDQVLGLLEKGREIRRDVPFGGRIHIDRRLPFLCVYRQPSGRNDAGTERLVLGEASYLIASGRKRDQKLLRQLIRPIVEDLSKEFGAFLLVEVYSWNRTESERAEGPSRPEFSILAAKKRNPTSTIEALEDALKSIKILKRRASVKVVFTERSHAPGLPYLMPPIAAKKLNCFTTAVGVNPVYRDRGNGHVYPLVLRKLHHGVSHALKKGFFEFSRTRTSHRIVTYQSLGRRALVKAVWDADRSLAEISNAYDFLFQVTPTNIDLAWRAFKKTRYEKNPVFFYRPRPVDPAMLKRRLFLIRLERIEDPTLGALFREKRQELERQLTMLEDRGSKKFLYGSLQLYGGVSAQLEDVARRLIARLPARVQEGSHPRWAKAGEFAEAARREIALYREKYPAMSATVEIRDDIVGLMVSNGNLLIGRKVKVPVSRVNALLQHEVGTHVLTFFNGRAQPFHQLYCGLAGYDELQEGLAVLSEYLVGGLSRPRLRLLAGRVIAVKYLLEGASFVDTFRVLNSDWGFEKSTAFNMAARVYRAGGLTKDAVYLRGLVRLLDYLRAGGKLENLFIGKISAAHVPIIDELKWRGVLKEAPLVPHYMEQPSTATLLRQFREGRGVLDLIGRRSRSTSAS
jgi:uncharacterized protein (TIGR02421 family)